MDYHVTTDGGQWPTLYLVEPMNDKALKNLEGFTPPYTYWWGNTLPVEHRFIRDLVSQLTDEGWEVS